MAWTAGIEIKKVGKDSWSATYKQPGAKWNKYFPKTAFEYEGLLPPKD